LYLNLSCVLNPSGF